MDMKAVEKPIAPRESRWHEFWRLFKKNRLAFFGLLIFIVFFLSALVGLALIFGLTVAVYPRVRVRAVPERE